MRDASANLISLLSTSKTFYMADCYSFFLADGNNTRLDYTTIDVNVGWNSTTFASKGLLLQRSKISLVRGMQVSKLEIDAYPTTATINGTGFLSALCAGALDGAWICLYRVFFSGNIASAITLSANGTPLAVPVDGLMLFAGTVSEVQVGRTSAHLSVSSVLEQLNRQYPVNLYQPGCRWALYSPGCNANQAAYTSNSTVFPGSTYSNILTNLSANFAEGYFDLGVISFTSGNDAGLSRTIKKFYQANTGNATPMAVWVIQPLPYIPAANDAFAIYPGCDKTLATCANKFNNANQFGGMPFIPTPETAT